MLTLWRSRVPGNDDGLTLAELIVAMTITMILMTVAVIFFVGAEQSGYKSVLTNQTTADARTALDSWTRYLRVAGWFDSAKTDRFEEITPTKIVFYANLGNQNTSDLTMGSLTKVALLLRVTDASTGDGELMEITFKSDNTTPQTVHQVAFNASRPDGGSGAIFQPYNSIGGSVDVSNTMGCKSGSTPTAGLCLQSPPSGAGMLDPQLAVGSSTPTQGPLRGNSAVDVDSTLENIAGVTVDFTVSDPTHTASQEFTGGASVNSGFPS